MVINSLQPIPVVLYMNVACTLNSNIWRTTDLPLKNEEALLLILDKNKKKITSPSYSFMGLWVSHIAAIVSTT